MAAKRSKDPFEAAFQEQQEALLHDSPTTTLDEDAPQKPGGVSNIYAQSDVVTSAINPATVPSSSTAAATTFRRGGNAKEDDEDDDEDNLDVQFGKLASTSDPDKLAKMQEILSQFTEEQMSRYECFRRSGFQKANMKRLLASITGSQKISVHTTIAVSGIAKMFVGELVETARVVMAQRKETGPIRPCHIREAHRRLRAQGKLPKRTLPKRPFR